MTPQDDAEDHDLLPALSDEDLKDDSGEVQHSRSALRERQRMRSQAALAKEATKQAALAARDAQALIQSNDFVAHAYGTAVFAYKVTRLIRSVVLNSLQRNYSVADAEKTVDALLMLAEGQAASQPTGPGALEKVLREETLIYLQVLASIEAKMQAAAGAQQNGDGRTGPEGPAA